MSRIKGKFAKSYDSFVKRESLLPDGLFELVRSYSPEMIADFGCGTGSVAAGLSKAGYQVTGVDKSKDSIPSEVRTCV